MTSPSPSAAHDGQSMSADELARLHELLKRCSPETFDAAAHFRRTGDRKSLGAVVIGVIERYVERDLRPMLREGNGNVRLCEDLGLDSLTLMEIVLLAEDVLQITVTNDELTQLKTVRDVHDFLSAKIAG